MADTYWDHPARREIKRLIDLGDAGAILDELQQDSTEWDDARGALDNLVRAADIRAAASVEAFAVTEAEQASTDPAATEHLRAGDRITLDELAVHLNAASVWLRQLAMAGETPDVPVDLGANLCNEVDHMAQRLEEAGQKVAELNTVIAGRSPLAPTLPDGAPWGSRALDPSNAVTSRAPVVIPTMYQVLGLARWHQETRALVMPPPRPERQRTASPAAPDGIAYLDGIADVPGLDGWESPRAAERRARERAAAIQVRARQEPCATCDAAPGDYCRTKTNRVAETFHRPRITAATKAVDEQDGEQHD